MSFPQRDYLGELFRGYASVCQYPVSIVSFTDRASQAHKLRFDPIMMTVPIIKRLLVVRYGPAMSPFTWWRFQLLLAFVTGVCQPTRGNARRVSTGFGSRDRRSQLHCIAFLGQAHMDHSPLHQPI